MRSPVASGFGTTRALCAGRSSTRATWATKVSTCVCRHGGFERDRLVEPLAAHVAQEAVREAAAAAEADGALDHPRDVDLQAGVRRVAP